MLNLLNWKIKLLIILVMVIGGGVSGGKWSSGLAQGGLKPGQPVTIVGSSPGACTSGTSLPVVYLGTLYQCVGGTYSSVSTTAAGGSITGLTATRVPVAASATTLTDSANFVFDSANARLVVGGPSTGVTAAINAVGDGKVLALQRATAGTANLYLDFLNSAGTEKGYVGFGSGSGGPDIFSIANLTNNAVNVYTNSIVRFLIDGSGLTTVGAAGLTGQFNVTAGSASTIGQIIKLAASQSADALEVQDSSANVIFKVTNTGRAFIQPQTGVDAYVYMVAATGQSAGQSFTTPGGGTMTTTFDNSGNFFLQQSAAGGGSLFLDYKTAFYLRDSSSNQKEYVTGAIHNLQSGTVLGWSSSATVASTAADIGLVRNAAGVVEINNGTAGTYRDLIARNITSSALTSGRVPFATTGGLLTDSANLTWDNTNSRLAVGGTTGVAYGATFRPAGADNIMGFYTAAGVQVGSITYGDFILTAVGSNALDFRSSTTASQPIIFSLKNSTGFIYFRDSSSNNLGYFSQNTSFATFNVLPPVATQIGQIIKLAASQSADASQIQDSTSAVLSSVTKDGYGGFGTAAVSTASLKVGRAGEGLLTLNNSSSSVPNVTIGIGSGSQHSDGYFFFDAASTPTVANQMFVFVYSATTSGFAIGKTSDTVAVLQAWTTTGKLQIADNVAAATASDGIMLGNMLGGLSTATSGTRRNVLMSSSGFAPTSGTGVYNHLELSPTINQTGGASGITRGIYVNPTLTAAADWRGLDILASYVNTSGTLQNVYVRTDLNAASASSATVQAFQSDTRTQGSQNYTSTTGLQAFRATFTGYGTGTITWVKGFNAYLDAFKSIVTNAAALYATGIAASGAGSVGTKYGLYIENQTGGTTANYSIYSAGGASLLNAGTSTVVPLTLKGAASQSANLQEWQNSSGTVLSAFDSAGRLQVKANTINAQGLVFYDSSYGIGMDASDLVIWGNSGQGVSIKKYAASGYNGTNFFRFDSAASTLGATSTSLIGWSSGSTLTAYDTAFSRISAGVIGVGTGAAGSTAGSLSMTGLTLSGNFFAGPSTIETFTSTGSAIAATLNYYTDSQTIYYSTAAAANDVTLNVDASASVDLNTRLATGNIITVVLAMTNTGTAYKCNTLQIHTVGQTIKWVGGSAPTGNINATDFYTFTIMKTGASTYYVTGSQTSYK